MPANALHATCPTPIKPHHARAGAIGKASRGQGPLLHSTSCIEVADPVAGRARSCRDDPRVTLLAGMARSYKAIAWGWR